MTTIISRREAGLPAAAGGPRHDPRHTVRLVIHYNGPAVGPLTSLREEIDWWRGIYDYHTRVREYSDVAYTVGVGPATGKPLAGRMLHRWPAAHEPYNEHSIAIYAMVGEGDTITGQLLDGLAAAVVWAEQEVARHGGELRIWQPHQDVPDNHTECPGPLAPWARDLPHNARDRYSPDTNTEDDMYLYVDPREGSPDSLAALWATLARPDLIEGVTASETEAVELIEAGRDVRAVGGPAADNLSGQGAGGIRGANAQDTMETLVRALETEEDERTKQKG